jgi:hypothetical protein
MHMHRIRKKIAGNHANDNKDLNMTRYPRATRKLSEDDIKRLDELFPKLNRLERNDEEFERIESLINALLYS